MSDKTIKHFVISRFFTYQSPKYPYDVFDVNFLTTQLPLAKNMLRSLENQTNKDFETVFIFNNKVADDPKKYESIFLSLRESTTLPLKLLGTTACAELVKNTLNEYDYVIQTRMDFDDFVYKDAVADTQSKVNECDTMLVYGYCKGYRYIYGELYPHYVLWNGNGHHSVFQSLILNSSFAKKMPFLWIERFYHDKFKPMLKKFLDENKTEFRFSDDMLKQNTSDDAYIYYNHEYSQEFFVRNLNSLLDKVKGKEPLTAENIKKTKKQLEDEFGFFHELNSIK
jgi:hypothetical protein